MRLRNVLIIFLMVVAEPTYLGAVDPPEFVLLWNGIYTVSSAEKFDDPTQVTGKRSEAEQATHLRDTTRIPARLGTRFGIGFMFRGRPDADFVKYRVVWRFPSIGIKNPKTKKTTSFVAFDRSCEINSRRCFRGYVFDEPWELVPGRWRLEIWMAQKMISQQEFEVMMP